jgi:hypothetical protein
MSPNALILGTLTSTLPFSAAAPVPFSNPFPTLLLSVLWSICVPFTGPTQETGTTHASQ